MFSFPFFFCRTLWCSPAVSLNSNSACHANWPISWQRCTRMGSKRSGWASSCRIMWSPTTTLSHSILHFPRRASTDWTSTPGRWPPRKWIRSPAKNIYWRTAANIWLIHRNEINNVLCVLFIYCVYILYLLLLLMVVNSVYSCRNNQISNISFAPVVAVTFVRPTVSVVPNCFKHFVSFSV